VQEKAQRHKLLNLLKYSSCIKAKQKNKKKAEQGMEKLTTQSVGYHVDKQVFYNPFLAFLHAAHNTPNETVKFVCYDSVFTNLDWTVEPTESIRELIDARTRQLAQRYDKIILAFSGGTDSITVYNSFVRQNIFIDEIIISYSSYTNAHPVANVDWLLKNHPDKNTIITVLNRNDPQYYTKFKNENWVLENSGNLGYFNLSAPGAYFYRHCVDSWGNTNWAMIIGYEKPNIIRENNKWLAVHLDKVIKPSLSYSNLEYFFLTPDFPKLHLKQNHMLLRYIKQTYADFSEGWSSVAHCGKKSSEDYIRYAAACGLDSEVTRGQGFIQKKFNDYTRFKDMQEIMNNDFDLLKNIDPVLKEKLREKDRIAKNYMNGWQSLQSDQTLLNYMVRHGFLSNAQQSVEGYHGIWGEKYVLDNS
jgi:hypothetical protein